MHSLNTGDYVKHGRAEVKPRHVLRGVVDANLKSDRSTHFRHFADKVFDGLDRADLDDQASDLLAAIVNSWFSYHYPSVLQDAARAELTRMKTSGNKRERAKAAIIEAEHLALREKRKANTKAATTIVAAETSKKLATLASGIRKHKLLDEVVLPNGKKLRDATGDECGKTGGWLSRISHEMAMRGVVNGTVGDTLTEKQVQKLLMQK